MKKCPKCGNIFDDSKNTCSECSSFLNKMDDAEQREFEEKTDNILENQSTNFDDFAVTFKDKIIIALSVAEMVLSIVLMNIYWENEISILFIFCIFFGVANSIQTAFPEFIWKITKFSQLRDFQFDGEVYPSDFYILSFKISKYVMLIINALILIYVMSNILT